MNKFTIAMLIVTVGLLIVPVVWVSGSVADKLRSDSDAGARENDRDREPVREPATQDRERHRDADRDHHHDRDHDARGEHGREHRHDQDREHDRDRGHDADRDRHHDRDRPERDERDDDGPPHKTAKLEFKLLNDDDQPTFHVLCVSGEFAIDHDISESNGSHQFAFGGELTPLDEDGQFLMHYEATMRHANNTENVEGRFETRGSAMLKIGKSKKLAVLGNTVVQVTATWDD